jgi:hypothetical protein
VKTRLRLFVVAAVAALALGLLQASAGAISANPQSIDFGRIPVNTTVTKSTIITLDAGFDFQGFSGLNGIHPYFASSANCFGLHGPATCTVNVEFSPQYISDFPAVLGVSECSFIVCVTKNVNISGTAFSIAELRPSLVNFGDVPVETQVTKPISFTIDRGYSFGGVDGSGATDPFVWHTANCFGFSGPGTCKIELTFKPILFGTRNGVLRAFECPGIGGTCPTLFIDVTGRGIYVSRTRPTSINFGNVIVGRTKTITASITPDTFWSVYDAEGSATGVPLSTNLGTCANRFTGPGTCRLKESFTPTFRGSISAVLSILVCPNRGGTCRFLDMNVRGNGV